MKSNAAIHIEEPVPVATVRKLTVLDSIGATLSFGCAIHCIALPFVITALPLLGLGFLAHTSFEAGMIVASLTLATSSFCWGVRVHRQWKTFLFIAAAATFFILGHVLSDHDINEVTHAADGSWHWVLMGMGGFALASGHFLNHRLCKSCKTCSH